MHDETQAMEWTPERVRRFWDYESTHPERYFTYKYAGSLVATVKKHLAGADRVLDYGCGRGFLVEKLLDLGARVAAADDSPRSVAFVQERFQDHDRFLGARTVDQLHESGERYDAIFVIEVVEHLDDASLKELFERVLSAARPDALLIVTTPNAEKLQKSEVYCPACDHRFHRWGHVRSWTAETLSDHLESIGLRIVETIECRFAKTFPGRPWKSRWEWIAKQIQGGAKPHLVAICRVPEKSRGTA